MNTGMDSVLELTKTIDTKTANTRILIKFDTDDIPAEALSNTGSTYYLNLASTEVSEIPLSYDIYAYAISGSWEMGTGKSDYLPIVKEGASWTYRDGYTPQTTWFSGSGVVSQSAVDSPGTIYYVSQSGGGAWWTSSIASQSYEYESADLRMDVKDIINEWELSSSFDNEGFIIKRANADESSSAVMGSIKFYSVDSHTIFPPRLEICWDDSSWDTGTLSPLISGSTYIDELVLNTKNLRPKYKQDTKTKVRVLGRERYASRTYSTTSAYLGTKYLPTASYYSIKDMASEEVVVPFDDNYTKMSCDSRGNYFNFWANGLQPERYYRFIFKVKDTDGNEEFFDNDYFFKIVR
jgi:hypothetical protein